MWLYDVSVRALCSLLEATAANADASQEAITKFSGYGKRTAREALSSLVTLNLVERNKDGSYRASGNGISRGMGEEALRATVAAALFSYRPFEAICEGLAYKEGADEAVTRAAVKLGLGPQEESRLPILLKWGADLGLVTSVDGRWELSKTVGRDAQEGLSLVSPEDVESEAKARLFIARRLGEDAYDFLDPADRRLLASSLVEVLTDPSQAVEDASQALEDYLREVCNDRRQSDKAKKLNGPSQLASMMLAEGLIHGHHSKFIDSVSAVRAAKAHGKDKRTLAPWSITEHGAFAATMMTLTAIRSVHEYVYGRRQSI
jgi:hypothetical protein